MDGSRSKATFEREIGVRGYSKGRWRLAFGGEFGGEYVVV